MCVYMPLKSEHIILLAKNNKSVKHCANNPIKTETAHKIKINKIFLFFHFMIFVTLAVKLMLSTNEIAFKLPFTFINP